MRWKGGRLGLNRLSASVRIWTVMNSNSIRIPYCLCLNRLSASVRIWTVDSTVVKKDIPEGLNRLSASVRIWTVQGRSLSGVHPSRS